MSYELPELLVDCDIERMRLAIEYDPPRIVSELCIQEIVK